MPKNNRTTITQNWEIFYECITNNLTKEIEEEINKTGEKVRKGEEIDRNSRGSQAAAQFGMLYKLKEYGLNIKKSEKEKKPLDLEKMQKEMEQLEAKTFLPQAKSGWNWNFSESYREAMNKFSNMIFENEKRKVEYALKLRQNAPDIRFTRQELEGILPTVEQFEKVANLEVLTAAFAKMEKQTGNVFIKPSNLQEMMQLQKMVLAHPKVEKFYSEASPSKLIDVLTKGNILEELKIDFEILPEKMIPNKNLENELFGVDMEKGMALPINIVPSVNGKTDYYAMENPERVMDDEMSM